MKFHLTRAFPLPAAQLWNGAVEDFADAALWDRSVVGVEPVRRSRRAGGPQAAAYTFQTTFGAIRIEILEVRRDGDGGTMTYTIAEGLPAMVRTGRSIWTISSDGPDDSTFRIDVELLTNSVGTIMSPLLKPMLRRADRQVLDDLYAYLVTGEPSMAKQKADAKRRKG